MINRGLVMTEVPNLGHAMILAIPRSGMMPKRGARRWST